MPYDSNHSVNAAECLALAELIERVPLEEFDMSMVTHSCGAPSCMAGWWAYGAKYDGADKMGAAAIALNLSRIEESDLFTPGASSPGVDKLHDNCVSPYDATSAQAARVLRHLAATGEVDWSVAL